MSLSVVGGLGSILNVFFEMYIPQGHTTTEVVWLGTFPSLFVGVGMSHIVPISKNWLLTGLEEIILFSPSVLCTAVDLQQ